MISRRDYSEDPFSGRRRRRCWLALGAALAATGCHADHRQSMLHPESAAAAEIAWLWWLLLAICAAVFFVVVLLTGLAVWKRPSGAAAPAPLGNRFILICGAVIPAMILAGILYASVRTQVALRMPETDLTIRVIGHQWWWEVVYPDAEIVIANELVIPAGAPVRLELLAADVIHSLWVPNLNGKTDLIPDKVNLMWLTADRPGVFRGQCAEYCGVQHALMALRVVALERDAFDDWIRARQQPVAGPRTAAQRRGERVFMQEACHNCHAIRGTPAVGTRGPDLTHLKNRRTLAAGVLPNTRENLKDWIADPQRHKPGNLMPRTILSPDDLAALVDYLDALE